MFLPFERSRSPGSDTYSLPKVYLTELGYTQSRYCTSRKTPPGFRLPYCTVTLPITATRNVGYIECA